MMSKIALISRVLDHFYPSPPIPLNHFDNFSLLVSVVLSAQTTDGKVNEVTKPLFEVAPTPQLMSAMEASEIQKIIQPVGLAPKKSVYLKKLSQMLLDNFNGEVPSSYEGLESLPGVGHKTASVVMSQAFGESALAVDTHVHRLALRWGLSTDEKNVDKVQLALHGLFPEQHWNKVHLQMIYFGREYCTAKLHNSKECPICSWVNKKDGQPSISFVDFTPKKKSKGIVFYEDRITELKDSPHLARGAVLFSPVKCEIKNEIKSEVKVELKVEESGESGIKSVVKKVRKSVVKKVTGGVKGEIESVVVSEVKCEVEVEVEGVIAVVTGIKGKKGNKKENKKGNEKAVTSKITETKVEMETEIKVEVTETPTTKKRKVKTLKTTNITTEQITLNNIETDQNQNEAAIMTETTQLKLDLKSEDMKTPTKRMKKEKSGRNENEKNDVIQTLDFSSPKPEKKMKEEHLENENMVTVKHGTRASSRKIGV